MQLRNKNILVTGACGFIGSHLVEELCRQAFHVRAMVCYNSFNRWGWLDTVGHSAPSNLEIVSGDIRDPHGVRRSMEGVDIVFHLAALIAIPYSYHSPDSYVATNVSGTLNVLQAARDLGTERIVVTSTSEVYGTARYVPIDENHPRQGQSPYSATKIAADAMAEAFLRSFDLPVTIARPFNTYGPRQSARAVIPTIITQLLAGRETIHLGALSPTRDLVFVKDTVAGFIAVATSDRTIGEEVNIATGCEISIEEIATMLIDEINPRAVIACDEQRVRPAASEVERLLGSRDKIGALTGWRPETTLREGLSQTVEWFRKPENLAQYKAGIYNI